MLIQLKEFSNFQYTFIYLNIASKLCGSSDAMPFPSDDLLTPFNVFWSNDTLSELKDASLTGIGSEDLLVIEFCTLVIPDSWDIRLTLDLVVLTDLQKIKVLVK